MRPLPAAGQESSPASARLASIDILRGAVMVLMAIDHVRVYAGVPAGGSDPGVFFTRWVTHFCAPVFVFLAGSSAFLYGRRHSDLPRFLLIRGAWLILLELTVIRVLWTFNFDFANYMLAGVIWVIGWSMILLAAVARLPVALTGAIGVAMILSHNLLDPFLGERMPAMSYGGAAWLWKILFLGFWAGPVQLGESGPPLMVLYSIIPWAGVMAAGYAFGAILLMKDARRRNFCCAIGLGAIALFLLIRGFNLYGDPRPWGQAGPEGRPPVMPPLLDFLNTSKYPASLSFLLMTLGPAIALIPVIERARGIAARALIVIGRVPFFFYLLHIPLIHALALGVSIAREGTMNPWLFANHPMGNPPPPDGYPWSLPLLYLIWGVASVILYFACRWFAGFKAARRDPWLRYL